MEVLRRTPRTEMRAEAIQVKMGSFYQDIKDEDREAILRGLAFFSNLSARVVLNGDDELDFELASPGDSPEEIRRKYEAFLDTQHMDWVDRAVDEMRHSGVVADEATGPTPPKGKKSD
jgi:hypothetical protein